MIARGLLFVAASLVLLGCSRGTAPRPAPLDVNEVGNGGDFLAGEFVAKGYFVLDYLRRLPRERRFLTDAQLHELELALKDTRIELVEETLPDKFASQGGALTSDDPKRPGKKRIRLSRKQWEKAIHDRFNVYRLVLHEYLWVIGVDDSSYRLSHRIALNGYESNDGLWSTSLRVGGRVYVLMVSLRFPSELVASGERLVQHPTACSLEVLFPGEGEILFYEQNGPVLKKIPFLVSGFSLLGHTWTEGCGGGEKALQALGRSAYREPRPEEVYFDWNESLPIGGLERPLRISLRVSGGLVFQDGKFRLVRPQPGSEPSDRVPLGHTQTYQDSLYDAGHEYQSGAFQFENADQDIFLYHYHTPLMKLSPHPADYAQVRRLPYPSPRWENKVLGSYEITFANPNIPRESRVFVEYGWRRNLDFPAAKERAAASEGIGAAESSWVEIERLEMQAAGSPSVWRVSLEKEHRVEWWALGNPTSYPQRQLEMAALDLVFHIVLPDGTELREGGNFARNARYTVPLRSFRQDFSPPPTGYGNPGFQPLAVGTLALP